MAKKTFTINAAGVTAGQQLDATSIAVKLQGSLKGADVYLEASDTDGNYVTVSGGPIPQNVVKEVRLPVSWYVRTRTAIDQDNPSATLTIE